MRPVHHEPISGRRPSLPPSARGTCSTRPGGRALRLPPPSSNASTAIALPAKPAPPPSSNAGNANAIGEGPLMDNWTQRFSKIFRDFVFGDFGGLPGRPRCPDFARMWSRSVAKFPQSLSNIGSLATPFVAQNRFCKIGKLREQGISERCARRAISAEPPIGRRKMAVRHTRRSQTQCACEQIVSGCFCFPPGPE